MIEAFLWALGAVLLSYWCWKTALSIWERLRELGIKHSKSSFTFFDEIFISGVISLLAARLVWMGLNLARYTEVPWGLLPYSRTATETIWLTLFPWRVLQFSEGVFLPVLWGLFGFLLILYIFIPTISLARRLKLEKRGIMRNFILRSLTCCLAILAYFGALLVYYW
ncbi:MAG: hypothetical protein QY312_01340 [Candidatus Dojkabacteria bacterium]|nr:MAG: hypothetical protein QY312_01340 [Candidatus Dojkabacteria bacterium]